MRHNRDVFTRVEAENYRCLKKLAVDLGPYQVLVGPNSSGKSTFLDVVNFFSDLIRTDPRSAANERSENFHDLVWGREGSAFCLAIEARVPEPYRISNVTSQLETLRYQVRINLDHNTDVVSLDEEVLTLRDVAGKGLTVLERTKYQVDYRAEDEGFSANFTLGPLQSGLGNLPMDRTKFPATAWFKNALLEGVQMVVLDNQWLHASSPPGEGNASLFDGLQLARRIHRLYDSSRTDFNAWIKHVQTALPDIETIRTVFRPEDKHRYVMVKYKNGIEVPAWMLSDGTLRLIALTLLAYGSPSDGVYLVEEPEVGVHPSALETIVQSLSSVYDGQVIISTHSPLVVGMSEPENLLCFSQSGDGTKVIRGSDHPLLKEWQSRIQVGDLFASGVLG